MRIIKLFLLLAGMIMSTAWCWAAVDYTLPAGMSEARLSVANTLGTVVLECGLSGGASQRILDLRGLGSGVYTYTVSCGKLSQSGKLVIVK